MKDKSFYNNVYGDPCYVSVNVSDSDETLSKVSRILAPDGLPIVYEAKSLKLNAIGFIDFSKQLPNSKIKDN